MRATVLMLFLILGTSSLVAFGFLGKTFAFIAILFLLSLIVGSIFMDKAILFFLGAREVRSSDQPFFFEAASQAAYKLSVPLPKIYIYEGSLERGFVLENKEQVTLVLSRTFVNKMTLGELSGVCFSLLLQVKKKLVVKRTKVMFLIGGISWILNNIMMVIISIVPSKSFRNIAMGFFSYLLNPFVNLFFDIFLGQSYFKKLLIHLNDFPVELSFLRVAGMKIQKTEELYSLPSRKIFELSLSNKSSSFKNILVLEMLPHEWDYFFLNQGMLSAQNN